MKTVAFAAIFTLFVSLTAVNASRTAYAPKPYALKHKVTDIDSYSRLPTPDQSTEQLDDQLTGQSTGQSTDQSTDPDSNSDLKSNPYRNLKEIELPTGDAEAYQL